MSDKRAGRARALFEEAAMAEDLAYLSAGIGSIGSFGCGLDLDHVERDDAVVLDSHIVPWPTP